MVDGVEDGTAPVKPPSSCMRVFTMNTGAMTVAVVKPAVAAEMRCEAGPGASSADDVRALFTFAYVPKYTARAGATPAMVGTSPRTRPLAPSVARMWETVALTLLTAAPFMDDW